MSLEADPAARPAPRADLLINRAQSEHLDALRGIAAQLVLIQHALGRCLPDAGYDRFGLGALGVLTFFLLSGFLITDSVASKAARGRYDATEFLISRFARIYTPYVPAILLVAALDWFSSRSPGYEYAADYDWPTALANVAMLQDFPLFQILRRLHVPDQAWFFKSFGSGRQFWTVSIEWWIYVAVGIAAAMAVSTRRRASPIWRIALAAAAIEPVYNFVGGPGDCLTLAWMLGGAASLLHRRGWQPGRGALAATWLGCLVLAGVRLFFTHGRIYEPEFALLLTAILFLPLLRYRSAPAPTLGRRLGLDRLSFNSYSLYLTHGSIVVLMAALAPASVRGWAGLALVIAVTNLFAAGYARVFEVPHRRVRAAMLRALGRA